jgi:hypothetical protein
MDGVASVLRGERLNDSMEATLDKQNVDDVESGNPAAGSDVKHLHPEGTTLENVELSIVIPAMNEEITVGEFIEWCKEGLKRAGVSGQILIVDSSTDNTPRIVLEQGGEVLRTPKRGVGRAYIDAIPFIRGKWILMGDADLTYDFREIAPFVEEFRKGAEFVMGSRFRGSIEKGAMPKLHRYFGTPLTNWILNRIYRSNYSDIHCGIRGVTRLGIRQRDGAESCATAPRRCRGAHKVLQRSGRPAQSPSTRGLALIMDGRVGESESNAGICRGFIPAETWYRAYGGWIVAFFGFGSRTRKDWSCRI